MKNRKIIVYSILSLIIFILILALFFVLQTKNKFEYQINSMNFKAPTTEENCIGVIKGKIIIPNYQGYYNIVVSAYLESDLSTVIEQVETDENGDFTIFFASVGTYNLIIEQSGCIKCKLTDLIVEEGKVLNLEDTVLSSGDVNSDNEIEIMDLTIINDKFSKTASQEDAKYDLNNDGKIDENDRDIIKNNYGKKFNEQIANYTTALIDDVAVAQIGTKKYLRLGTAISAVPETDTETTITMLANTTETVTIQRKKNIILETNGKTITGTITNIGTLKVQGNGKIISSQNTIVNNNELTVSGDITIESTGSTGELAAVQTGYESTLIVESGTIKGNMVGIKALGEGSDTESSVTIKGGNISGTIGVSLNVGSILIADATITGVTTGVYTRQARGFRVSGNTVITAERGIDINSSIYGLSIADGTITGTLYEGVRIDGSSDGYRYTFGIAESYSQTFTNTPVITGGTYGITATNSINFNDGTIRGVSGAFNLSEKTIYLPKHSKSPFYEYGIKYTSVNGYQTATITTY